MYWVTSSAFLYFNCFVKKSNSGSFRKFPGWFHHSSTYDLFSSQRIARMTFIILTAPKHLYASPPFFMSLDDCTGIACILFRPRRKRKGQCLNLYTSTFLQALKFKANYVSKIIYFCKGERESASALILFLQFQGFEFRLFILPPCLD